MEIKPFYEVSKRSITMNKSEEPFLACHNSGLAVRTEKGLNLFNFSYDVQCIDKKLDYSVKFISCSKTSPASSLFSRKIMHKPMRNFDFTQMIVDPSLWPHNTQMIEENTNITAFEWAPPDFMLDECFIAVLNNFGNVELFKPSYCGFKTALNISCLIKKSREGILTADPPQNIQELKAAVYAVETSAICWGSRRNGAFIFLTAQKNGDIYFWKLQCYGKKINIEQLTMLESNSDEIITIKMILLPNDTFLLIFTNVLGQLFAHKYRWENENFKSINQYCLWSHKDRMMIKYLKYFTVENRIIIICNKHRHLLILMMDDDCNKISEYINNVNDYRITVICETNNEFYVGTVNCNVFKINITLSSEDLKVNLTPISIKENFAEKEMFGMDFSKNSSICVLTVVDRRIMHRKENKTLDVLFLCQDVSHEKEMLCLLNNPTKKLTYFWDCIEMLRYKTMKLKILPSIDYDKLYTKNKKDIYKLKVYYILLTLYNTLEKILKNSSKGWLPETSIEVVRERILVLHACSVLTDLYTKSQNNDILIGFESEAFVGARKYVHYYCQKYNVEPIELIPSEALNIMEADCKYTCQCCDEKISGFSCTNGHLNMFCSLTFTPILSDNYLICKGCGIIARIELLMENPMCVFCDLYLNDYMLPS